MGTDETLKFLTEKPKKFSKGLTRGTTTANLDRSVITQNFSLGLGYLGGIQSIIYFKFQMTNNFSL